MSYIKAQQEVGRKNQRVAGGSSLKHVVFGDGAISKEDKRYIDGFLKHVMMLMGNDPSAQEMSVDAAVRIWHALIDLDADSSDDTVKSVVKSALGSFNIVDLNVIPSLYSSFVELRRQCRGGAGMDVPVPTAQVQVQVPIHGMREAAAFVCGGPISYWTFVSSSIESHTGRTSEKRDGEVFREITEEDMQQASVEACGGLKERVSNKEIGATGL